MKTIKPFEFRFDIAANDNFYERGFRGVFVFASVFIIHAPETRRNLISYSKSLQTVARLVYVVF